MPSYSPVFSAQFIVRAGTDPLVPFIVPAGFTAVIRDFSIFSSGAIAEVILTIQNDSTAPEVKVAYLTLEGIGTGSQWQGRVVVPENGIIGLTQIDVGDSCHIYVGGYLLRNVIS